MYKRGEFSTAEKSIIEKRETARFDGSKQSMLRILKKMGFRYKRCNDGRKFLMEQSNAAARAVFLPKHEIRQWQSLHLLG
jgi:hypothetical protein